MTLGVGGDERALIACGAVVSEGKALTVGKAPPSCAEGQVPAEAALKSAFKTGARPQLKSGFMNPSKAIRYVVDDPDAQGEWEPWVLADRTVGYKHRPSKVSSPEKERPECSRGAIRCTGTRVGM